MMPGYEHYGIVLFHVFSVHVCAWSAVLNTLFSECFGVKYCIVLIALSRCNRVFTRRLRLCHSHTVRRHEVRKGEREGLNRVVSGL